MNKRGSGKVEISIFRSFFLGRFDRYVTNKILCRVAQHDRGAKDRRREVCDEDKVETNKM